MRNRGTFNFSGNLEVKKDAPLDARMLVSSYDDLKKTSTWADEDGNVWFYNYMIVACEDRPGKLYQLIDKTNYVNDEAWKEISGGSGGGTGGGIEEAPTDSKVYGRKNANWSEITVDDVTVKIPVAVSSLTTNATSDDIIRAFGSKEDMAQIAEDLSAYKLVAFVRNTDDRIVIMYIPHFMSQYTDADKFTMTLEYEMNEIHRTQIISMSGGSASIQVIEVPQADTSVFLFKPSLTSDTNKITQQNYNDLQAAIQANKVIMAPFGFMNSTVDGNYVPVNAYLKSDAIALEYVADNTHSYINIASDLTVSFVNDDLAFEDTTVKFIDSIGTVDLNTVTNGTGVHEAVIAVQTVNSNATLDKNYPVEEAGSLISIGTINGRTNQMYLAYNNADLYARTAGSGNGVTPWKQYASTDYVNEKCTDTLADAARYYVLGEGNLNDFTSAESIVGVQNDGSKPTLERNYPVAKSGMLIAGGAINNRSNQIYHTFDENRLFIRGAGVDNYTSWEEIAKKTDIPTNVSQLNNDSGYITSSSLPTKVSELQNDSNYATTSQIPTNVSQLTNDSNYATKSELPTVPTNVSAFTNDAGYAKTNDVLSKTNTTEYTPTSDYNPAPKAYVDNSISNSRSVGYMMQLTEIDASGLDENTWYPVVMSLGNRNTVRIEVIVGLDSGTKPSWSTHDQGFSVRKIWEVNGLGWGTSPVVNHQVFVSDYVFADTDPVRGLAQLSNTSEEYVFVRGGGKYFFYTSHGVIPELKTETYEGAGGQSVSPTTETPAEIVANMATKEYVDEKVSNIFDLEGFDFKTATQSKKEEFIKWIKGTNQVAHIIHDEAQPIDDLYIPVSNYKYGDYGSGESITLNFIAIDCSNLNINALIYISVYNSDTGSIDLNSTVTIDIKRYNIDPDYIKRTIITSDNLTTITKKTSGEYEALTKDGKTMYAVTD